MLRSALLSPETSVLLLLLACGPTDAPKDDTGETGDPADAEIVLGQLTVGDLTFDTRSAGPTDGELVLLLHGFPETSHEWREVLPVLGAAGYHAVAPDQRGYSPGARPAEVEAYAIDALVADVVGMADALGAERFHVVGHDWGAGVAWSLASAHPERLYSLSAVSVPHIDAFAEMLDSRGSCQYAASAYFDFFVTPNATGYFLADDASALRAIYEGVPTEAVDVYVAALGTEAAMDGALNWYRANVDERNFIGPELGPTTVPTLFVWSDADTAICQDTAESTADFVTAPYRYEVYAGVNHWVADLAGPTLAADVRAHLDTYAGSGE